MPKQVLITGGTSGIGLALAQYYHSIGWRVGIIARHATEIGENDICQYSLNVANRDALELAFADFCRNAPLDLLIAAAGQYCNDITESAEEKLMQQTVETNICGTVNTLEAAKKHMCHTQGKIAVIASISGLLDYPQSTLYTKTKRAVIVLCDAYRQLYAVNGISLTCIMPGYTDTPKLRELNHGDLKNKPFVVSLHEAVSQIVRAVDDREKTLIFPTPMHLLIKFLSYLPKPWIAWIMMTRKRKEEERTSRTEPSH